MYKRLLILLVLTLSIAVTTACVRQDEYDSLQQHVKQQDRQLQQIQPAQADSWAQMQSMRQEINQLRGQIDDLALAGGAKQMVAKLNRHEAALRQIESSMALDLKLGDPTAVISQGMQNPVGISPYPQQSSMDVAGNAAYAGLGQSNSLPPDVIVGTSAGTGVVAGAGTSAVAGAGTGVVAGAGTGAGTGAVAGSMLIDQNGNVISSAAPVKESKVNLSKALYDAGVSAYAARKYEEAQRSFVDFTKNYPTDKNIPNAWFYIGECYFQLNKFADAALAYDTIITKYSTSTRAPLAYLKQGIAFSKLGKSDAAKARIQDLIKKYPNTPEAARAKAFLKTNK